MKESEIYTIPMIKKEKNKKMNPKTNRMKNFKKTMYHETDIPPGKRTFENLPRYTDKSSKVKFQDWLLIKPEKISPDHSVASFGKSDADSKFYGWSHRAVYGFGIGDNMKSDTIGNSTGKEYTIKTNDQARQAAIVFAKSVS